MTHVQKVIDLCSDGQWHCQKEFRTFSWSPHKRRADARDLGYEFEERPCTHGIDRTKDYRMVKPQHTTQPSQPVPNTPPRASQSVTEAKIVERPGGAVYVIN